MEDSLGYVWFAGYYDGLHRFSRKDGTWKNYRHDSTDSCSIAHDKVISLHIDDSRRLWICTEGGGVCRYDYGTDRFRKLNLRRPDSTMVTLSVIYGILNDSEGRIWLSSNNGIWCCGTDGEVFRHLAGEDGLQSNQYNFGASFKSSTGLLYFGGINGFNVINPENLKKNPVKPGVTARAVISGEKDAGQSGRSVIPRNANSFSVNFECLSYTAPDRNLFAYRIDRQQEWITTGEPSVTFINFPYGTHHIHVRARNGEGLWSDEIVLGITNLPPLSKSRTARIMYLLAAATLLFLALSFAVRRMKEQERVRAKEAEIKREQEEYNERIKFFTQIAHEIKTPVTLIKAPLEIILKSRHSPEDRRNLDIIEKNGRLSAADIAAMIGADEEAVAREIERLEDEHVICGYRAIINWNKTDEEKADAFIEVKVSPQRGVGFDQIAERIWQYPEVSSIQLISGSFDFAVFIQGRSMREVAMFVSEKLSTIDGVLSTSTQFVLKNYKDHGIVIESPKKDERLELS